MHLITSISLDKGIPYAKPPLGPLRFSQPVLIHSLNVKNFEAQNFGPGCLQTLSVSHLTTPDTRGFYAYKHFLIAFTAERSIRRLLDAERLSPLWRYKYFDASCICLDIWGSVTSQLTITFCEMLMIQ